MKNKMDMPWFYRGFRRRLKDRLGAEKAALIWSEAGEVYASFDPALRAHKGAMVLPAVALYRALEHHGEAAEVLLNDYGDHMGRRFAGIVHAITGLPGVSQLLWRNIDRIMDKMSGEALGYRRRIASEPPEMYGVDILSCPYHELAKALQAEKAVLCICHMDKAYMKGFHHIRYERTTAVSEGAECCDYRLRYD